MFAEVKILVKVYEILAKRLVLQKGEMVKKGNNGEKTRPHIF